ncbi:hypothetical protein B4U80_12678 [Leptotrombidium deliense]|uniref:Peptidase S1 domain-containing protein n=1 Tax=Leptotrombidium deliense TaxID=299467 RepID=A0A443SRC8_9ACAR|nr:hypothetical protein B4U80_12678 [Leptotrombidium deliense]
MTAGWGLTGNGKASDVLMHFITTDGLKDERSKSRFCKDLLCLKPGSGRFESGDSGGPAWITVDNRAVIIGIVSHYRLHKMRLTRVPLVKDWIMKNTESARYCQ